LHHSLPKEIHKILQNFSKISLTTKPSALNFQTQLSEAEVIHLGLVRVKEAEVPLGERPRLLILVKQGEDEPLDRLPGPRGGARLALQMLEHVIVVRPGVVKRRRLAPAGPPGLRHHDRDVVVAQGLHGEHGRVVHGVEEVGVVQARARVVHARGVQEQRVLRGDVHGVGQEREVGVYVHHERGACEVQKAQQRLHDDGVREHPGRGPVRRREHAHGVRRGDFDLAVQAVVLERRVELPHCRDERGPYLGDAG
jgi:hypothetical protein